MLDFLSNLYTVIEMIGTIIVNFFNSLWWLISHIPDMLDNVILTFDFLPSILYPFAVIFITVSILLFILNRQGGY